MTRNLISVVLVKRVGLGAAFVLVSTSSASAAPTLYPRPDNRLGEVVNPTGSDSLPRAEIVADTNDRNTLWVFPPSSGGVELSNFSASANLGFCEEMAYLQDTSLQLAKLIEQNTSRISSYNDERDALYRQKEAAEQEAARLYATPVVMEAITLQTQLDDLAVQLSDAQAEMAFCLDLDCVDYWRGIASDLRSEMTTLRTQLREVQRAAGDDFRAYQRATQQADALQGQIDNFDQRVLSVNDSIIRANNQLFDMYAKFAALEGGTAGVAFDSGWDEAVTAIKASNPTFNVQAIETREARINVQVVPGYGDAAYLSQLPAALHYSINGLQYSAAQPEQSLPALPDTIAGLVRLSLTGACPMARPQDYDLPTGVAGLPLFGVVASYVYPTVFRTHVRAEFNLWRVYEYMKRVKTKSRWFSSSTSVTEQESTTGGSDISFEFYDEQGLTPQQKAELEEQIEAELMMDVLRLMGVPVLQPGATDTELLPPPPSPATSFPAASGNTCGWWNVVCGSVSWIIRGLSSLYGGSVSEVNFKQTYDVTVSREYRSDNVYYRSGVVEFAESNE